MFKVDGSLLQKSGIGFHFHFLLTKSIGTLKDWLHPNHAKHLLTKVFYIGSIDKIIQKIGPV